jgi:hypothetical protein
MLLSRVCAMKFEVCQERFLLLSPQTSLDKHGTITQITPDIPQTSLHKHGTAQNTADTPQTSLHPCLCNEV